MEESLSAITWISPKYCGFCVGYKKNGFATNNLALRERFPFETRREGKRQRRKL